MPGDDGPRSARGGAAGAAVREIRIGRHLVRLEPPDLLHMVLDGDVPPAQAEALVLEQVRYAGELARLLVMVDVSRAGQIALESRKVATEHLRKIENQGGIAVVGASFHLRVLLTLISKVLKRIGKREANPIIFLASEAEARAWIAERRRELDGARRGSP